MNNPRKILIIDDSLTIVQGLKIILKKKYTVLTSSNGPCGLETAKAEKPELILLDIMLPQMDGYTVCRKVKEDPSLASSIVLLFTTKGDKESREKGEQSQANGFVSKESGMENILKVIEEKMNQLNSQQ